MVRKRGNIRERGGDCRRDAWVLREHRGLEVSRISDLVTSDSDEVERVTPLNLESGRDEGDLLKAVSP